MTRLIFLTLFCISLFASNPTYSQSEVRELPTGYFMTVSTYSKSAEGYAIRYVKELKSQSIEADYGYSAAKKMYFVYIKHYESYSQAIAEIESTREGSDFKDAWVYRYQSSQKESVVANEVNAPVETEADPVPGPQNPSTEESDSTLTMPVTSQSKESVTNETEIDHSKLIFFNALDAVTQEPVNVEAKVVDPYSGNELATLVSQETSKVEPPSNIDGIIEVKTSVPGWRADAVTFNFENPINDSTDYFLKYQGDTLIVLFDMHKLKKGEFHVLYNVYFIPDASVMKPISEYELKDLLAMMEENPNYRIRLHGHTNGNSSGTYYRLSEGDTDFFSLSSKHEKTKGSAKKLSYDRANTIKQYLVHNGITGDRIELEGWGGKNMLYDRLSVASNRNIRVEVEIIDE